MDFDGDLYGQRVRVELVQCIRNIHPFTTVDARVAAMKEDEQVGRKILGVPQAVSR
jgi:riboflavin kinase / FMN adenylyltransferase